MKKAGVGALLLLLLVGFCSCGQENPHPTESESAPVQQGTDQTESQQESNSADQIPDDGATLHYASAQAFLDLMTEGKLSENDEGVLKKYIDPEILTYIDGEHPVFKKFPVPVFPDSFDVGEFFVSSNGFVWYSTPQQ